MRPTVRSVLLCEDAREERNGKHILIGVYTGAVIVPRYPATLRLTYFVTVLFNGPPVNVDFRISDSSKEPVLNGTVEVQLDPERPRVPRDPALTAVDIAFPKFVLKPEMRSELRLSISFDGKPWKLIHRSLVLTKEEQDALFDDAPSLIRDN